MSFCRRVIPYLVSQTITCSTGDFYQAHHPLLATKLFHIGVEDTQKSYLVVSSICDAFRRGWSWDTVSRKFDSLELDSSIVEKVLLHLKEPVDVRQALGFFHWSARSKGFEHGTRTYCIAIHILVRAGLLRDARALLESALMKTGNDPLTFCFVDSLLCTYEISGSRPRVFDLLVQTYSKLRMFEAAFDTCVHLEKHGFSLSLISFNTLLHVVEKSEKNVLVWEIYEHMIKRRIYPNEATIMTMIGALCKEGNLGKYVDVLDRINGTRCSPSVIVNTSLIFRVLEEGRIEEGMALLRRILQKNMILDTVSYSLVVYAKVKFGNLDAGWEVYEEMVNRGFRANAFLYTLFIGAYCTEGRIDEANCLMQEMEYIGLKPYDETFNHLILGCSKVGRLAESLKFCEKMMRMGLVPSASAGNEMLGKLCESGNARQANAMLTRLLDKGFLPQECTYSYLITGYGKEGKVDEVLKLYYEMEYRSIPPGCLTFESLITNLCECGKVNEAEKYLVIMKDRKFAPSVRIYESLIASYAKEGDKTKACYLYNEMTTTGLKLSCSQISSGGTEK